MSPVLFSSNKDDWATPAYIFEPLNERFKFDIDICATDENTKCGRWVTPEQDALRQPWDTLGKVIFMNPPYSQIKTWMSRAFQASMYATVVCLVPARTDTFWFHEYVWKPKASVEFFKGRITFENAKQGAPFPSCLVIYDPAIKVQTVGPCLIKASSPASRAARKSATLCGSTP